MGLGIGFGTDWGSIKLGPESGGGVNPDAFIIQVKTDNTGTSNNDQFTLPWVGTYDVDWGDGNVDTSVSGTQTHTYASSGTYDVSVTATTGQIIFNNGGDKQKLLNIKQWGTCQWTSMLAAFRGCSNMNGSYTDSPNLSNVTTLNFMFDGCTLFNHPVNFDTSNVTSFIETFSFCTSFNQPVNFDTSNITRMDRMFELASSFDQPLDNWDVSNVTNMYRMFYAATSFNQPLDNWDVSSVTNMQDMFRSASAFNQPLNNWNTSNVITMNSMFRAASNFNSNINGWDLSSVTTFSNMFRDANSFNQAIGGWTLNTTGSITMASMFYQNLAFNNGGSTDINNWNTSNVTNMTSMFYKATAFNQPIGNWSTSNVTNVTNMLANLGGSTYAFDQDISNWDVNQITGFSNFMTGGGTGLSTANYDALLIAWDSQGAMSYSGTVNFGSSQYTLGGAAEAARTSLISKWGGIIDGGGIVNPFTTNLVASYNFDKDFTDYTGNNDAISHNSALISVNDYVVNKGLNNTQGTAYLTIPDSNDFSFTDGVNDLPFSISFWINFSTTNLQAIIWKGGGSSNREYRIQTADGFGNGFQIKVMSPTTDFISAVGFDSSPYSINTFYHLAFTYDGSGSETGLKIYVNGVDETTTTSQTGTYTGMVNSNFDTAIGVRGDTLSGLNSVSKIDELHIWKDRELSAAEVLEIYNTEDSGTSILP